MKSNKKKDIFKSMSKDEAIKVLLNSKEEEYKNPFEIENMDRAVECFKKIYKEDLVVGLLIDEDVR